jgi:hypothetical protein
MVLRLALIYIAISLPVHAMQETKEEDKASDNSSSDSDSDLSTLHGWDWPDEYWEPSAQLKNEWESRTDIPANLVLISFKKGNYEFSYKSRRVFNKLTFHENKTICFDKDFKLSENCVKVKYEKNKGYPIELFGARTIYVSMVIDDDTQKGQEAMDKFGERLKTFIQTHAKDIYHSHIEWAENQMFSSILAMPDKLHIFFKELIDIKHDFPDSEQSLIVICILNEEDKRRHLSL